MFSKIFRISLITYIIFLFWQPKLPPKSQIIQDLKTSSPIQKPIIRTPFTKSVDGANYKITPLYDYQIQGLVVADYDSQNWLDVTHKKDPAQTKDLCLIWGTNLENAVYRDLSYSHGEFTCFVKWTADQQKIFDGRSLSNNHLIPADARLAKAIKRSHPGDQVLITGQLVNYELIDANGQLQSSRNTSTIREDRDCEIIFVTDFKVLQSPLFPYYQIKQLLPWIILVSGLTSFLLWLK